MRVFINGQFVPEAQASVSVFDRGFLYGDGLFEAIPCANGKWFRWDRHFQRLQRGSEHLQIRLPYTSDALREFADRLLGENSARDGLLRLTISRGVGRRGYSPAGADRPTVVMTLHPRPEAPASGVPTWKLITSTLRLPAGEPLAQFKTCNKLAQILARAEADAAGADEALLTNTDGFVVEGSTSNLFWVDGGAVCTPSLASGILAGVTRSVVVDICGALGMPVCEASVTAKELARADGVFVSLSSWGIVEAQTLDGQPLTSSPQTGGIRKAYLDLLRAELA